MRPILRLTLVELNNEKGEYKDELSTDFDGPFPQRWIDIDQLV